MSKGQTLQDPFLNSLRKDRIPVSIFLVNGIKLQGQIESFDQYVVLLKNTVSQMVYKHAISTVVPARNPRPGSNGGGAGGFGGGTGGGFGGAGGGFGGAGGGGFDQSGGGFGQRSGFSNRGFSNNDRGGFGGGDNRGFNQPEAGGFGGGNFDNNFDNKGFDEGNQAPHNDEGENNDF